MKCKDCKHWEREYLRDKWADNPTQEVKKCNKVKMFWDSTDWDKEGDRRIFLNDDLAFVQDGSDYHAELLTKSEFGCVMWEAK